MRGHTGLVVGGDYKLLHVTNTVIYGWWQVAWEPAKCKKFYPSRRNMTRTKTQKAKAAAAQAVAQPPAAVKAKKRRNKTKGSGSVSTAGRDRIEVIHVDESVGQATAAAVFTQQFRFQINPGLAATFPVASAKAKNMVKWRHRGPMTWTWTPQVNEVSVDGVGVAIMSFNDNAGAADPATQTVALNQKPSSHDLPCKKQTLRVNVAPENNPWRYVRTANPPKGVGIEMCDSGLMWVTTQGQTSSGVVTGEIHVQGDIEVCEELQVQTNVAPKTYSEARFESSSAEASGSSGVATTLALATATTNGLGATNAAGVVTLPVGNFRIAAMNDSHSTGTATSNSTFSLLVNGVALPYKPTHAQTAFQDASLCAVYFVSSNGSTTVALSVTNTYGSGTLTNFGALEITSV